MPPVSVCHQVSTIGSLPFPTLSDTIATRSGFIGSPTVPITLKEDRSWPATHLSPPRISALIAVGAA